MFAKEGLEGVVAARTSISLLKGSEGVLEYRGYSIDDLAEHASFEEVAFLLWRGELPSAQQLNEFRADLAANRRLPESVIEALEGCLRRMSSIDALRTAVSISAANDPDLDDNSRAANLSKAIRLTAMIPQFVAAHLRISKGLKPVAPDPKLGHAANFLHSISGRNRSETETRALEVAMILLADHGLNASTFAARVTAGTLADLHSAIVAAISAMKGALHGGAACEVMRTLEAIASRSRVPEFVREALAVRRRIPGFGHRIYKTTDPRAIHLKRWCERLANETSALKWFEIARALEMQVLKRNELYPNVDLYSAPLWSMLGLPPDTFASLFAAARIPGWAAHVMEQYQDNRLIRPTEEYIGPLSRRFTPIIERGEQG